MAKSQKQFEGWSYLLQVDDKHPVIDSTRTRRSRKSEELKLVLKREEDGLELQEGDCLLIDQQDQGAIVALIKEIRFGTDDFIEIKIMWFVNISEVELEDLPKSNMELVDEGKLPTEFCENDIFITALQDKIYVDSIIDRVNVLSETEFRSITIDDSNRDTTFVCRRGCSSSAADFTDPIDWRELHNLLTSNSNEFYQKIKALTVAPTVKTSKRSKLSIKEVVNSKTKSKTKTVTYKEVDTSDSSDDISGSESDDLDAELDEVSTSESELLDSDDEYYSARKRTRSKAKPKPKSSKGSKRRRTKANRTEDKGQKKVKLVDFVPSLPVRSNLSFGDTSDQEEEDFKTPVFKQARKRLHANAKLKSLPCREQESQELYFSLHQAIESEIGTCIYVSGTPGTGKTATIREVVKQLVKDYMENEDVESEKFDYVEINGLKLISPQSSYEVLWEKISGQRTSSSNAVVMLDAYFKKKDKSRKPLIVLMDELDQIVTKTQTVMYNFFNWPTYPESKLIVIAVANTMDLPERLLTNKISSRLGLKRLQFPGYDYKQLAEIIKHRLQDLERLNSGKLVIKKDAIEFAARKVASVSGDARRALIICRRAIELAELDYYRSHGLEENPTYTVQITHIMKAVNETTNSPVAQFLESLSFVSKLFITCLLARKKKSGLAENSMDAIIDEMGKTITMQTSARLNEELLKEKMELNKMLYGVSQKNLRIEGFNYIVQELIESGILLQSNAQGGRLSIVKLNVNDDEVISVFKKDENLHGIGSF